MKLSKLAISAALSLLLWGRGTVAQEPNTTAAEAGNARSVSFTLSDEFDTQVDQLASYSSLLNDDACGCNDDACCDCGPCCQPLADLGEANKWFDGCFLQERGISAGGWVAQSYTWNPYRPVDKFNGPLTWTDRSNEYQLNEVYFFAGKAANTEGCGWDYGWRVDSLYGTNYRWDTSSGLESKWNTGAFYGLALPQAYVEIARNDLTVKVGHFISPVGFYTVGTANNFFPIIPYTYQYGEPFTHTGAIATYKASDKLSVGNGFVRGWDNFDSTGNPNLSYLGTASYTRDNGDTLAWVGLFGREPNLSGLNAGFSTRYFQTLVYTKKFSDDVTGVLQSDYGIQGDALANGGAARWYGINSYLYWNQTCRLQWGLNGEWFRDEGGVRVGQLVPSLASPGARGFSRGGFDGSFYRLTVGPKYYFTPNLYTRAAFVADWYQGKSNANGSLPFDDGTKLHQQVGVFDLVLTF